MTNSRVHPASLVAQRIMVDAYEAAARALLRRDPTTARWYASVAALRRTELHLAAVGS